MITSIGKDKTYENFIAQGTQVSDQHAQMNDFAGGRLFIDICFSLSDRIGKRKIIN